MKTYDVAVIGAGVFGSWTAWHLARAGKSVLLVDAWGAGHTRSSSGGESRIIRMGYGDDEIYTRMSMQSLTAWHDLFRRTGQSLFHATGALWMARDDHPHNVGTLRVFNAAGVRHEIISQAELARRYPQIRMSSSRIFGIYEPDSGALMARRAVAAVVDDAARSGVDYRVQSVHWPDTRIDAGAFVFACGPWLPKLFPDLLAQRIFTTRQEVFFFARPRAIDGFQRRNCRYGSTTPIRAAPTAFPIWRIAASSWHSTGTAERSTPTPATARYPLKASRQHAAFSPSAFPRWPMRRSRNRASANTRIRRMAIF